MLFFALICFFTAMGLKDNPEAQGFVGFLMVIVGGAGLIVYLTNRSSNPSVSDFCLALQILS